MDEEKLIKLIPCNYEIKEVSEEGIFSGYASVFDKEPDSYGDIVEMGAFKRTIKAGGRNKNGIAMLMQHRADKPIGVWTKLKEDDHGLYVEGKLAIKTTDGNDVYELMKIGALKGLSIGYTVKKFSRDEDKNITILQELELWEISPVTFPAKINATVSSIKSIENASNERELEMALRESGLSKNAALYLVKLCRPKLRESVDNDSALAILKSLKEINKNLKF